MPTRVEIVTAERVVYADDVDVLVVPGVEGELGILSDHAPLLTVLQPGVLRVVKDGQEHSMVVSGGFIEVLGNRVTVLADTAERAEEIDLERAQEAVQRAQECIAALPSDVDLERALMAIRRAKVRIQVGRRRRPPPGTPLPPPPEA